MNPRIRKTHVERFVLLSLPLLFLCPKCLIAQTSYYFDFTGNLSLWDLSGTYTDYALGGEISYTLTQDSAGKITGYGTGTMSMSGLNITATYDIDGSITQKDGIAELELSTDYSGTATYLGDTYEFTAKETTTAEIDASTAMMTGVVEVELTMEGYGSERYTMDFSTETPEGMDGSFELEFDIYQNGTRLTGNGILILSNSETYDLTASGKFKSRTNESTISLRGSARGSRLRLSVDGSDDHIETLRGKILGQELEGYDIMPTNPTGDDHGDWIGTATSIIVGNDVSGVIEHVADVDYFVFHAQNGAQYTIETTSGTLTDTEIFLLDENNYQLAYDDDSGFGNASKIVWTCNLPSHYYAYPYYVMVRAYNNTTTGSYTLRVTSGGSVSKATSPSPTNGATNQSINADIGWSNGGSATSYDVYFGTDSTPDSGEFKGNQSGTTYDPGTLAYSTTYYWRIDAKNSAGTITGDVWYFITTGVASITPQPIPYTQDFSSSKPDGSDGWEYYSSSGTGSIEVVSGQLRMDSAYPGGFNLNEAVLHLNLSGKSGVSLTLDHYNTYDLGMDEYDLLPDSFTGHSNGDGISVSADGVTWYLIENLGYDLNFNFTAREVSLDTVVLLAGISYTSDFRIKFQQYDDTWYPHDGRIFDNISITNDP